MKPNRPWHLAQRTLALALVTLLCGAPQLLAQAAQSTQPSSSAQGQPQQGQPTTSSQSNAQPQQAVPAPKPSQSLDVDPSKGPLQPVPSSTPENQPTAVPTEQPPANAPAPQPQTQTQKPQPPAPAPQGVAAAGEAKTNGGPASEPAGTAIAPAKQHQTRSLLIKIGAVGAGAAALGVIYALSRGTSSHPPNTAVGATQAH